MIRIAITAEAFEAIAASLPLGSTAFKSEAGAKGERFIWLEPRFVDRLRFLRGPGESYSDVILRLAAGPVSVPSRAGLARLSRVR